MQPPKTSPLPGRAPRHSTLPTGAPRGLGVLWARGWGPGGTGWHPGDRARDGAHRGGTSGACRRRRWLSTRLGGDSGTPGLLSPCPWAPLGALGRPGPSVPALPVPQFPPAELPLTCSRGVPWGAAGCRRVLAAPRAHTAPRSFSFCTSARRKCTGWGWPCPSPPRAPHRAPQLCPPAASSLRSGGAGFMGAARPSWTVFCRGGSTVPGLGAPQRPPKGGHPIWGCSEGPPPAFGERVQLRAATGEATSLRDRAPPMHNSPRENIP